MILEQETFDKFGYFPKETGKCSEKMVLVKCDYCGETVIRSLCNILGGRENNSKDTCSTKECKASKSRETFKIKQDLGFKVNINKRFPYMKSGHKSGHLTLMEDEDKATNISYRGRQKCIRIKCLCDCGKEIYIINNHIRNCHTKSCGCKRVEMMAEKHRTHRSSKTRLYALWNSIKCRCNPDNKWSKNNCYTNKNIKVCEEWSKSFQAFKDWSILNGYAEDLSIDRINPNKDYCPENCQWITLEENCKRVTGSRDILIDSLVKENQRLKDILFLNHISFVDKIIDFL